MSKEAEKLRRELVRVETGRGRRYPADLRQRVVAWAKQRHAEGASRRGARGRRVGKTIGVYGAGVDAEHFAGERRGPEGQRAGRAVVCPDCNWRTPSGSARSSAVRLQCRAGGSVLLEQFSLRRGLVGGSTTNDEALEVRRVSGRSTSGRLCGLASVAQEPGDAL
jgi:hypothetical protein